PGPRPVLPLARQHPRAPECPRARGDRVRVRYARHRPALALARGHAGAAASARRGAGRARAADHRGGSRRESRARRRTIRCGDETRPPPLDAGMEDPGPRHRETSVQGPRPMTYEHALPAGPPGRVFVGRKSELAELRARLDRVLAGRGSVVLVAGEPGIGKSELADRLGAEAASRGAEVLWGRSWEGEGAPPYWPWAQIIRAHLEAGTGADLAS